MEEHMIVIRDPKTFCFNIESNFVDENLNHETEFII